MNRREAIAALTATCGAAGLKNAHIKVIDRDPKPLLAIIECDAALTPARLKAIRDAWEALKKLDSDIPPCVVLERGLKVTFQTGLDQ